MVKSTKSGLFLFFYSLREIAQATAAVVSYGKEVENLKLHFEIV
jgi:hypothetical protein